MCLPSLCYLPLCCSLLLSAWPCALHFKRLIAQQKLQLNTSKSLLQTNKPQPKVRAKQTQQEQQEQRPKDELAIPDTRYTIQDTSCQLTDTRYKIPVVSCQIQGDNNNNNSNSSKQSNFNRAEAEVEQDNVVKDSLRASPRVAASGMRVAESQRGVTISLYTHTHTHICDNCALIMCLDNDVVCSKPRQAEAQLETT